MVSGEGVRQARELGDRDRLRELFANGAKQPHRPLDGRATRHVVVRSSFADVAAAFARDNLVAFGFACFAAGTLFACGAAYVWSFYL